MRLGADYRRIWFGNASANLADGITFIALPLLATTTTDSPLAIAGLAVAYSLSRILSVLGTGVLIDRVDRRRLLYFANFSRAGMFAALTALVVLDAASIAVLYAVYAVIGVIETLADGAARAVLPQAVPPEGLDKANSQIAGTQLVIDEFVGPPLGGLLFAMAAFAPVGLNAVAFLVAGYAFWRLRGTYAIARDTTDEPPRSIRADIREGAVWAMRHRVVRLLIALGGITCVAYMIPFSYLVLYAQEELGLDGTGYGLLLAFSALGGLLGSFIATRLRKRIGYGWSMVAALATGAATFAVISLTTNIVVVAIALAAYIGHAVVWNIMATSIRQRATPTAMMGRVGSLDGFVGLIGLALGAGAGGLLASGLGYRIPFAIAGAVFAAAAVLCLISIRSLREWEDSEAQAAMSSAS
ncbi:MFS transporter [Glycomyces buryatensis]|uniref:MFS transporter n=1 Tax=Glycomyces buryatensis TaxID=2570927 RepID=A0A4S8QKT4_9ACTN|nr:MFS transporter [Glycomyces buryatensis]THV42039.1 MFS transporter [Glycomyces buryatensis]